MKGRIFFGILVVIVGALLLLMALDLVPIDGIGELLLYIPSLFILGGLYHLVVNKFKRAAGPIVTIAVATIVQLVLLDILRWAYVWPIAIILVGVAIIAGGAGYHGRRRAPSGKTTAAGTSASTGRIPNECRRRPRHIRHDERGQRAQ